METNETNKGMDGLGVNNLERYCYNKLVESSLPFCYECKKFELLQAKSLKIPCYEQFKGKLITRTSVNKTSYTPDFIILDKYIIETKGYLRSKDLLIWKLFKHYVIDNNLNYTLFMPRNNKQVDFVINHILENESSLSSLSKKEQTKTTNKKNKRNFTKRKSSVSRIKR